VYKRLFTFGCSWTNYVWPTWADIIAYDQQIEFHNKGKGGAGNTFIASSILESDLKYKFTDTDLILVNWSTWQREDRVDSEGHWKCDFKISKSLKKILIKHDFLNKYNHVKRTTDIIIGVNKMFNINYQSQMIDYENPSMFEGALVFGDANQSEKYARVLEAMPNKNLFDTNSNSYFSEKTTFDPHPDILCHLNHAKKVYEELEMKLDERTIEKYETLQRIIVQDLEDNSLQKQLTNNFFNDIKDWKNGIIDASTYENFFSNDKYM
jgi:hypothetical protein